MQPPENWKPNFIGIGVEKAATTWIFQCLKEHPEVCGSSEKETFFFSSDHLYNLGIDYYYKEFYEECPHNKTLGEFTPFYIYSKKAAYRIYKHFPNVKLIICLRNPTERAVSHYKHNIRMKRFNSKKSFKDALTNFHRPIMQNIIKKGFYFKYLQLYFNIFPIENILVLLYHDIQKKPSKVIKSVYEFLNLKNSGYKPKSLQQKINRTGTIIRKFKVSILASIISKIQTLVYDFELLFTKSRILLLLYKIRFLLDKIERLNTRFVIAEKENNLININKDLLELLKKIYKNDVKNLENLIDKDLSIWYQ